MQIVKKIVNHFEEYILLPSLAFSVALIFLQVVMRYVFNNSISWSEELARYIFIWQLWLGVSYSARNQSHIRITMIRSLIKKASAQKILEVVVIVIWFAFDCFVIFKGWEIANQIRGYGQKSPALGLPMFYAYLSIPVGATLCNIRLIQNLVILLKQPAQVREAS